MKFYTVFRIYIKGAYCIVALYCFCAGGYYTLKTLGGDMRFKPVTELTKGDLLVILFWFVGTYILTNFLKSKSIVDEIENLKRLIK
jgi:hypothetical protein